MRTNTAAASAVPRQMKKMGRNPRRRRLFTMSSVEDAGDGEGERIDARLEALAPLRAHGVGAVHRADGGAQRAEARVLEPLPRRDDRRLADHSRSLHVLDVAVPVGDDPFAADQVRRLRAFIGDPNPVGEEKIVRLRLASLFDVKGLDLDTDSARGGVAHGGRDYRMPLPASFVTEDNMRPVRLLQERDLFRIEADVQRRDGILQLVHLRGAHDRGRHSRLVQDPGERDLGRLHLAALRQLDDALHHVPVGVGVVHVVRVVIRLRALRLPFLLLARSVAGKEAARERAPGDHADAFLQAEGEHLPLLLTVDEVVVRLHGDAARPAVEVGRVLHLRELPREHARGAEVAGLAGFDDVVQRLERLLDRRVMVEAVDLKEVDVLHAEAAEGGVDGVHDVLAGEAAAVRTLADLEEALRGDHRFLARGQLAQRAADDFFAHAARVHVRGVEEVDARLEGALEEGTRRVFVEDPGAPRAGAVGHGAEADAGDFETGLAEIDVLHARIICDAFRLPRRPRPRRVPLARPKGAGSSSAGGVGDPDPGAGQSGTFDCRGGEAGAEAAGEARLVRDGSAQPLRYPLPRRARPGADLHAELRLARGDDGALRHRGLQARGESVEW